MKDLMINLFNKPKVLFMLMLICICPLIEIIMWACPQPDCSAEAEALAEASANLSAAREQLEDARDALNDAYQLVLFLQGGLTEAKTNYWDAWENWINSLGIPILEVIMAVLLIRARARLHDAQNAYNSGLAALAQARAAYNSAVSAYNDAFNSFQSAIEAFRACSNS